MLRMWILAILVVPGIIRFMRLHLGIANDQGSPEPDQPFEIPAPLMAKAIYGRLELDKEREYYTFYGEKEQRVNLILYIPVQTFELGFRAAITVEGPSLPIEGINPELSDFTRTMGPREFRLVQRFLTPLPEDGQYRVTVRRLAKTGTYTLAIGKEMQGFADAEMRARINALLEKDLLQS